jgi:hypothetical protein
MKIPINNERQECKTGLVGGYGASRRRRVNRESKGG